MNYRHAFHAGNFADMVKHSALLLLLDRLQAESGPLRVVDTHAGAGLYDLAADMARKSAEAEAGVLRLMADGAAPPAFDGLKGAVSALNPHGAIRHYPGSPRLLAGRLRPGDSYVGAELHPEDFSQLRTVLAPLGDAAQARMQDGYLLAREEAGRGRLLVLVDPPFERADDYARAADLAGTVSRLNPRAVQAIWAPLKDLETLDAFVRRLEAAVDVGIDVAEVRLNGLDNPLKLNGCVMVFLNAPNGFCSELQPALDWVADQNGHRSAGARVWRARG